MTDERQHEKTDRRWSGRLAAILIFAFIAVVITLMFFAVRGPR